MNDILKIFLRFIGLLMLQVLLLDQIDFFGFINPLAYILFIVLYPFQNNRLAFLLLSFAYGLVLDTFQDTGGAHAAACVTLTFVRPVLLKMVYGESYLMKNVRILTTGIDRVILFMLLCVVIHHLVFYSLVFFDTSQIFQVMKMTLFIGTATLLLCSVLILLIKPKRS